MNADKAQLVWLGTRQQLAKLTTELPLLSALVKPSFAVIDLGINIDGQLTMADYIAALCWSCLFQLCQLRMVRCSMTLEAAKTLVRTFVSSCLDYCKSAVWDQWRFADKTPDCPECSSARHDGNNELWSYYTSVASTLLVSGTSANHLQVGNDQLQVPSRSAAILPGRHVHPRIINHRQVSVGVSWQRDTRHTTYHDYDQSARLRCVWPGHMEQPSSLHQCLRLGRLVFNWHYTNTRIHSFIHSFNDR